MVQRGIAPLVLGHWIAFVSLLSSSSPVSLALEVVKSVSNFPYDENNRLSTHMVVTSAGICNVLMHNLRHKQNWYGIQVSGVAGEASEAFFGSQPTVSEHPTALEDCRAVCLERGVEQSLVTATFPFRQYNGDEPFEHWFRYGCQMAEFCVTNFFTKRGSHLNMYWWNPHRRGWLFREKLPYGGGALCTNSSIGHVMQFEDDETKEVALEYKIEYTSMVPVGKPDPFIIGVTNFTAKVEDTLDNEWNKHNIVKRTFSPLGFKKGRLPDAVFASMGSFYYNNRQNIYLEDVWGGFKGNGVFVNWWEYDVNFLQIPAFYKQLWQLELLNLVEEWIGVPVEQTAMYGLRRYETGARLLTHVDRVETHAASLIVNVAQGNVEEPWAVELHDHQDRLHQITMEAGDVVYYESAKCLHGRNTPLKGPGAYYVNLFTHYRPTGDPDWWQRENPPGTPEPLGDVGQCVVEESKHNRVTCENSAIGPYLSPSMFTATSADDLFNWWRSVAPKMDGHDEL